MIENIDISIRFLVLLLYTIEKQYEKNKCQSPYGFLSTLSFHWSQNGLYRGAGQGIFRAGKLGFSLICLSLKNGRKIR